MNLYDDVKSLITSYETNIYSNEKPEKANNCAVISLTGGFAPKLTVNGDSIYFRKSFQIYLRNASERTALSKLQNICETLCVVSNTTINGSKYIDIRQTTDIFCWGKDKNNLWEFSVNFVTTVGGI